MSKRFGEPFANDINNSKKIRLDNNKEKSDINEDIWGEDLDAEEIEECLFQASQACSQNVSILPSYSKFKFPNNYVTSTQASSSNFQLKPPILKLNNHRDQINALESRTLIVKDNDTNYLASEVQKLTTENKKWMDQCLTKEGEVSILRNQLKHMQTMVDTARIEKMKIVEKQQQERVENIDSLTRQLINTKSELEFKELEIINLKERCRALEINKIKTLNASQAFVTENGFLKQGTPKKASRSSIKTCDVVCQTTYPFFDILHSFENTEFPLNDEISEHLFEEAFPETSLLSMERNNYDYKSTLPILQYDEMLTDFTERCVKIQVLNKNLKDKELIDLEKLYHHVNKLMKSSDVELKSRVCEESVNKVMFATKELLIHTSEILQIIREDMQLEDLKIADLQYLNLEDCTKNYDILEASLFSRSRVCDKEKLIDVRRTSAVVGVLCKYNKRAAEILLEKCENDFLSIIFKIVRLISETRLSYQFCGLLASFCCIFKAINENKSIINKRDEEIFDIFKEIIYTRPSTLFIYSAVSFIASVSNNDEFLRLLCQDSPKEALKTDPDHGLISFNKESCVLQLIGIYISHFIRKKISEYRIVLRVTDDLIKFISNAITVNVDWVKTVCQTKCNCFIYLINSILNCMILIVNKNKLLEFCKKGEDSKTFVESVCKNGISLLFVLTYKYYSSTLSYQNINDKYYIVVKMLYQLGDFFEYEENLRTSLEEMLMNKNSLQESNLSDTKFGQDVKKTCLKEIQQFD